MESFNWKQYLLNYPDLQAAGIIRESDAIEHYLKFGKKENRSSTRFDIPITIITPCTRVENLEKIKESINFDRISEWIIVYDSESSNNFFNDPKISEYSCKSHESISGNAQRNYALERVKNENSYLYFLDDDNLVHPGIFELSLIPNKIYTFNQTDGMRGKIIRVGYIDSAMFMVYFPLVKGLRWNLKVYEADGIYIQDCYKFNKSNWEHINKDLCYYNKLFKGKVYNYSELEKNNGDGIPKFIFKTSWNPEPNDIIFKTIQMNPGYKVFYFNDYDCETFLRDYSPRALNAYKKLIPGAFKADLFRYCILDSFGGCYSDIGHTMNATFDSICNSANLVVVKEIKNLGIHNGLLCSTPGHPFIKAAIEKCLYNIENEIYGDVDISITGPWMLKSLSLDYPGVKILDHRILHGEKYIYNENIQIIKTKFENYHSVMYPPDREHYSTLWKERKVFK